MKNTEILKVKEYVWGSIIEVMQDKRPQTIVNIQMNYACYLFAFWFIISFFLGVAIGRL